MSGSLPAPSVGVTWVPFGDGIVVHDDRRAEIHVLNGPASVVWEGCCDGWRADDLVEAIAQRAGVPAAEVAAQVARHVAELGDRGLVGRGSIPHPVQLPEPERLGAGIAGPVLRVLDLAVAVHVADPQVRAHVAARFRWLVDPGGTPDVHVLVEGVGGGELRVRGPGHDQVVPGLDGLDGVLPGIVNRVAGRARGLLALHASAVRDGQGRVLAVVGASGAGKSTLAAALVDAGWDYLGDEALGVRPDTLEAVGYPKPLALDGSSRTMLGLAPSTSPATDVGELRRDVLGICGDAGALDAVLLPGPERHGPASGARLDPEAALVALAPCAINLGTGGLGALEALVDVAVQVPVVRSTGGDLEQVVRWIGDGGHLLAPDS